MRKIEKMLEAAEKLKGYYGYRPIFTELEVTISEFHFRFHDHENKMDYSLLIFLEDDQCVDSVIDVRYSDGSIVTIAEDDEDFKDIVTHKNKIIKALNNM